MMDCFSTFFEGFLSEHKNSISPDLFLLFTRWVYIISYFTSVLSGIEMGVNIVCTLLLPVTHDWSLS